MSMGDSAEYAATGALALLDAPGGRGERRNLSLVASSLSMSTRGSHWQLAMAA